MKTSVKIVHWTPRIICIIAILFVSMFAFDSFSTGNTLLENLGSLLMNLLPSFMLIAFLIFAWKWEMIGGIIFIIIGLGFSPFLYSHNFKMSQSVGSALGTVLLLTLPFIIVGVLFVVSHFMKREA
jgi:hypothetical protein